MRIKISINNCNFITHAKTPLTTSHHHNIHQFHNPFTNILGKTNYNLSERMQSAMIFSSV